MQGAISYRESLPCIIETLQGRLGDEIGYVVRGRQRWRRYVKPFDPRTKRQMCRRRHFARLVSRWHCLDDDEKAHWNGLVRRARRKRTTGFNLFLSSGMGEFEAAQRVLEIKASLRSSRRFVMVKPRSTHTLEWHALLLHALLLSSAFRYRRE